MKYSWLVKMAWRDSRKNRGRLFLFMSSIILGIAALVAINSFGDNLKQKINSEAKELLGADLEVSSRQPISDELHRLFDSLNMQKSEEISFASMVLFPKNNGTRLINVRAVDEKFPFYGKVESAPAQAAEVFTQQTKALVDKTLLLQFNSGVGDSLKIGELTFDISGTLVKVPGQVGIAASVAPPVFIPINVIEQTGLLQKGSRINYTLYLKYPEGFDNSVFTELIKPRLAKMDVRFDDVAERKDEVGDAYSDLTGFLNLTAFVALLLGCVGVASSVHVYMKEKVQSIAVLRCLGTDAKSVVAIYLIQISMMALVGSVIGSALGAVIQYFLPSLFQSFLPFEIDLALSWGSILQGIALGVITAILFALFPLINIRGISPLKALRASFESEDKPRPPYVVYALIVVFIYAFSFIQLGEWLKALIFTGGLFAAFGLLALVAQGIIWLVRRFFPTKGSFILRQSLSNLYRPNNQTLVLVSSIGLGTALIITLLLTQQLLLNKVAFTSAPESRPNMLLFDIQTNQLDSVKDVAKQLDMPIIADVPLVTMRLKTLNGVDVETLRADTTSEIRRWVLRHEYRVTYRDSLTDSETIIDGEWRGQLKNPGDSVFVSLEEGVAKDMKVKIGDPLVFNVQGAMLTTYVGSIRKVDWQRVETNFLVVFPEGVLEGAPKFHVVLSRFKSPEQSAKFQQTLVRQFPNISIVDLNLILQTIDTVITKVSFVIRFMAFFSIITGLIVLIGSVIISKFQRMQESVLLRTLGASRKQILSINTLEYFLLGSLASLVGIFIAVLASSALAWFSFETVFAPEPLPLVIAYFSITVLTVIIGLSNSREVVRRPPLEVLRKEG